MHSGEGCLISCSLQLTEEIKQEAIAKPCMLADRADGASAESGAYINVRMMQPNTIEIQNALYILASIYVYGFH